jgi:hypothetical protein
MSGDAHRGQNATAIVTGEDSEMGLLQDLTISVPREYSELTGAGTNKVVDEQQTLVRPEVSGTWGTWTDALWNKLTDYDTTNGELSDTAEPPLFDVEVKIPATDGGTDTSFMLKNARPDSEIQDIPDSHATLSVTFAGRDIVPIPTA